MVVRTHPDGDIIVHLARDAHDPVALDLRSLPGVTGAHPLAAVGGATAAADGPLLHLQATAAGATVLAAETTTEPTSV